MLNKGLDIPTGCACGAWYVVPWQFGPLVFCGLLDGDREKVPLRWQASTARGREPIAPEFLTGDRGKGKGGSASLGR